MPKASDGVWMEITRTPAPNDATIVCPHSSRERALTAANETGNRAIMVRFGESLADALDRESHAGSTVPRVGASRQTGAGPTGASS